ncbi:hypothetical protein LCGC14_1972620 [marine sediment metagenome]|uniref:Uncharacterized protein n=1 Tax=marine sediment metagenome TaxID=412755 RepID=A0A0F9FZF6_9ZZZZ
MKLHVDISGKVTKRRDLGINTYGKPVLSRNSPRKVWSPRFITDWRSLKAFVFHRLAYHWQVPLGLAKWACGRYIAL